MDDLRSRIRRACAEADGFDFDSLEPGDYETHADVLIAVMQAELDRLGREVEDWRNAAYKHAKELADAISACRSTAALLRSTADRIEAGPQPDPLLLRMAAQDLDTITGRAKEPSDG